MQHVFNGFTLWGSGLLVVAALLRWRTARYDLKDKAIESAFQTMRGRRSRDNPTALEKELADVAGQSSLSGKATTAAGKVVGHFVAQAAAVGALVLAVIGIALLGYGIYRG